ncbi:MAG: nucleotidyl transferase AbiEii/AbiGii toxin family protein [Chloroflexi bacterium]|nr:nucleotidyl transferase AbiEii/AbiGii toxin family protein [Chloroflexota bacterium]
MTQKHLRDVSASVHQRLLNKAREQGRPFNELLQYYAMERFIYRLSKSRHAGKFILKGALMLAIWKAPLSRSTKDIDLLGRVSNDIDTVLEVIRGVCAKEVEPDGLVFDAGSVEAERIIEDADYAGVRVRFRGNLGRATIHVQLDIGFGDEVVPSVAVLDYPTILDLPPPRIQCYSRESAIAEKFQVMVKLDIVNSRMKDFFDIWLMSRWFEFDGQTLARAITRTFANRDTDMPSMPAALTDAFASDVLKQSQWKAFLRNHKLDNAPGDFRDIVSCIAAFLGPIANALSKGVGFRGIWHPPGPWLDSQS